MTNGTRVVATTWLSDEQWDRFWAKVDKNGPLPDASDPLVSAPATPCWVWTAATVNGYGAFTPPPKIRIGNTGVAHRLVYIEMVGPVADGLHVDHLCRNRRCVNPEHLELVTHRENILRGATVPADRAARTHCPKGHEYNADNTSLSPRNQRGCRVCKRERQEAYRQNPEVREHYRLYMAEYNKRKSSSAS